MTIDKLAKLLTVALCTVIFLTGCGDTEEFPFMSDAVNTADEVSEYRLVISDRASAELVDAAETLCRDIEAQTDVLSYVVLDSEIVSKSDKTVEVILGNTKRELSRSLLYGMRAEDYICREYNGSVLIGGLSDSATVTAINRFKKEILPASDKYALIPSGGGFEFAEKYSFSQVKLNGISVGSYSIVIESLHDTRALSEAMSFQRRVAEVTGFWMDIKDSYDHSTSAGSIYIVSDREDMESGTVRVEPSQNKLYIYSHGNEGIDTALRYLSDMLKDNLGKDSLELSIPETVILSYVSAEVNIASVASDRLMTSNNPDNISSVITAVKHSSPNLIFFGSFREEDRIEENLNEYSKVEIAEGNGLIYGLSSHSCSHLFETEQNGLLIEAVAVGEGTKSFIFVRISGDIHENVTVDVRSMIPWKDMPVAVAVHTYGEGSLILDNGMLLRDETVIGNGRYKTQMACYSSSALLDIELVSADICYFQLVAKYEGPIWSFAK